MSAAAQLTRQALDTGLDQMRNQWTPDEIIACLEDAALAIEGARLWCRHCAEEVDSGSCCSWCASVRGVTV